MRVLRNKRRHQQFQLRPSRVIVNIHALQRHQRLGNTKRRILPSNFHAHQLRWLRSSTEFSTTTAGEIKLATGGSYGEQTYNMKITTVTAGSHSLDFTFTVTVACGPGSATITGSVTDIWQPPTNGA